jgi:carbamoyltransferase
MIILGVSCFYHDAAAAIVVDGDVVAAAEEERFSRRKHDADIPVGAIAYCLKAAGVTMDAVDAVVFYEKPIVKFDRILCGYLECFPRSRTAFVAGMRTWLSEKLWTTSVLRRRLGYRRRVLAGDHHASHAASAFFASPFDAAALLTVDGVGEWATATCGVAEGSTLRLTHEIDYPHSLGLLYSAFTSYLGFEVNEGEYKVMGMAGYGRPLYVDKVRRLIDVAADGSFALALPYFAYYRSLAAVSEGFVELFGARRPAESGIDEYYADIAASIQKVTEETLVRLAASVQRRTGHDYLCLSGGVFLNSVANARILYEAGFKDVFIQPAAGDAGSAIGAALHLYHTGYGQPRRWRMKHAYLGPSFSDAEIGAFLTARGIRHTVHDAAGVPEVAAKLLADGNVVGWFQGRMEFGPRALGNRSILADPRRVEMKEIVNAKIKHREPFRPFAPAALEERAAEFFEVDRPSPYMLMVFKVRKDAGPLLPAITHVDGTARLQTVSREQNPRFYDLIASFDRLTGVPVVLNTSFNVRGEPIVCTPEEAYNTFTHTDMDYLFLGNACIARADARPLWGYPAPAALATPEVVV